jgi:hypothetical protein
LTRPPGAPTILADAGQETEESVMSETKVAAPAVGLEYEATYRARLKPPVDMGVGPYGSRLFFEVIDGEIEGERLNGRIVPGAGDWLLVGNDGYGRLDVRANFQMNDGANLYLAYFGVLEMSAAIQNALATGAGTGYEDHYFRSNPRFETGDPRYAWLTRTLLVGVGHVLPGLTVEYRVYRVT